VLNAAAIWKGFNSPRRLSLIAGPCVIESERLCLCVAAEMKRTCARLGVFYVFKASFDKANRTSAGTFRGPGLEQGLKVLAKVRAEIGVPVLTDVHTEAQAFAAAEVVDILQIPAFLCRQTDLIQAAVTTGKIVNLKKGQFLSPAEMGRVADMRAMPILKRYGFPVIFDATHSVQLPGGGGDRSSGQREFAPVLARCAVAAGANGIFVETHPQPDKALSDGPNMIPLAAMPAFVRDLRSMHALVNG